MPFTTPILDNFNRANENPLNTSNWQARVSNPLKLVSNQATGTNAADFNQAVWLPGGSISGDVEAYCTLGTRDSWTTVLARCPTGTTSSPLTGYEFGSNAAGTVGLARYNPNGGLGSMSLSLSPGDKIGISCVGTTISGWTWTSGGGWVQRLTATDSTFSAGLIGARQFATTGTLDDFGGGSTAVATPVADFTAAPLTGTEPLSVAFTDSSTNTPTSWAWTFGDGGTSTSQNPTHSYTVPGTYTVVLVATNSAGSNTKTRTGYITVSDQPRPIRINTSQGWADIGDATSFVSGTGAPTAAVGATGAIYLNTATGAMYGPKAAGAWPGTPLPVPAGTDATTTAKGIVQLAGDLTGTAAAPQLNLPYSSTPPASPADGQLWVFPADAANGVNWVFRYRSASASAYKWEFVGGSDALSIVATVEGTSSAPFVDLATIGPQVVLTRAGEYRARNMFHLYGTSPGAALQTILAGLSAGGLSTNVTVVGANYGMEIASQALIVVTAGATIKLQYGVTFGGSGFWGPRSLSITPVRVS